MREKLKQCPFCGGEAELRRNHDAGFYWVECDECEAQTQTYKTRKEVISAWNRRSPPMELREAWERYNNDVMGILSGIKTGGKEAAIERLLDFKNEVGELCEDEK